jgi:DNA-binding GntR family transcriptional regulator
MDTDTHVDRGKFTEEGEPSAAATEARLDRSLGSFVHAAIKAAIRVGDLVTGQRLRERDVAQWLGVSRTPVREGFRVLQAQGVLSAAGGDGLVITTLSEVEIRELYQVWADLEALAARYAARHATADEVIEMQRICNRWDVKLQPRELGQLNQEFHAAMHAAGHNRYLSRSLASIDDSLALLGLNTFSIPGRPAEAGREHELIVESIARRDPEAAFAAARSHIEHAGKLRLTISKPKALSLQGD